MAYSILKGNYQLEAFFALLSSGLWEQEARLQPYEPVDFDALYKLADEQAVVGLIGAGLEHIIDTKVQKMQARPFLTRILSLEQRNMEMNGFIGRLMTRLAGTGICAVLVKGQGIAQCYNRPLWRSSGDVDLFFDAESYEKAKAFLVPLAESVGEESIRNKHLGMHLSGFTVELHGTLSALISSRWDDCLADVQKDMFASGRFRTWRNGDVGVPLPHVDDDVIFVFSHILQHFYKHGIGLRQICDWCRLLYTYYDSIDTSLLEDRLRRMDVMDEWQAFSALAVEYLGMDQERIPLFLPNRIASKRAERLLAFILETGNFGKNQDNSYYKKHSYLVIKTISLGRWIKELVQAFRLFPKNSLRCFGRVFATGFKVALEGK